MREYLVITADLLNAADMLDVLKRSQSLLLGGRPRSP